MVGGVKRESIIGGCLLMYQKLSILREIMNMKTESIDGCTIQPLPIAQAAQLQPEVAHSFVFQQHETDQEDGQRSHCH